MRIGGIVHGFNVHTKEPKTWEEVVWGDPAKEDLGRLPQAVRAIDFFKPEVVVFNTGASSRDGVMEAQIMRDYLLGHILELKGLPYFDRMDLSKLQDTISLIASVEVESKNTEESLHNAGHILKEAGVDLIFLVSSPDHVSRCVRDANKIFKGDKALSHFCGNFIDWGSIVSYGIEDKWPLIIESPNGLYPLIEEMIKLSQEKQMDFLKELMPILRKYT